MAKPRKVDIVLSFLEKFETTLRTWPSDEKWPVTKIAEFTGSPLPHVADIINSCLSKTYDVHDLVTHKDADKAFVVLKQKMRADIEAKKRRVERDFEKAQQGFEKVMEKVRHLQGEKNWYGAYRTLTYFAGNNKGKLSREVITCICNDALRIGIKACVNIQELSIWLKKGIELALGTSDAVEDALDFVDAYGEYFLNDQAGKGDQFIKSLLCQLKMTAMTPESTEKFLQVAHDLNIEVSELSF